MSDLCIIPKAALADRRLKSGDIRVLCAIGIHTDQAGGGAWASARTFSGEGGVSRSQFFLSAKRLLELGYIRRRPRQGRSSVYSIVLEHKSLGVKRRRESPTQWTGTENEPTRPVATGHPPVQPSGLTRPVATGHKRNYLTTPFNENSAKVAASGLDGPTPPPSTHGPHDLYGRPLALPATIPPTDAERQHWRDALRAVGAGRTA